MSDIRENNAVDRFGDLFPRLRAFAARQLGNTAEAEEVVQEAFLRLHTAESDGPLDNPNAFLFRTTENLAIDRLRRRRFEGTPPKVSEDGEIAELVDRITPEETVSKKQDLAELLKVINTLPKRRRDVFLLSRVEGLRHSEIAALLGISTSTVEKHMAAALLDLTTRLAEAERGDAA